MNGMNSVLRELFHGSVYQTRPLPTSRMAKHFPKLILASRSPRRRELLAAAGYEFEVCPPSEAAEGGV